MLVCLQKVWANIPHQQLKNVSFPALYQQCQLSFWEKNVSISFAHRWYCSGTLDYVTNGVPRGISWKAFSLAS